MGHAQPGRGRGAARREPDHATDGHGVSETKPGGYWCVLTVDELPDLLATTEGVGIRFMASVSIGVFVSVGEQQRAAELRPSRS